MKVFITNPAKEALKNIYAYYQQEGYKAYAQKLKKGILSKVKSLSNHHLRGQLEESLRLLNQDHRYLLAEQHYKIIYFIHENGVMITDVFDTRQQPKKLIKRNR
ncbi:Plasmid stabilization system protein ParE [Reichenbachiella faecimaris]|uniref:Plasmid stabilization system protein ParE n=1 Tax=Reichenbachiella faecimaris TaxID=692418 RepID=A0A1W2GJY2_REIFA|nr:type II toxin-antitoxin system RelE/ParE family toxin [Reichenbachiella faecimaris]SMD36792.1 Plasmid stabilization system protein ParE [Reichenbachiella faecimaris]